MQSYSGRSCSKKTALLLGGEVELDECYLIAGQKGQPKRVLCRGRQSRRRRLRGNRGRGTAQSEKNSILGMVSHTGAIALQVLENVKQTTIRPIIEGRIAREACIYTDEYNIYNRVTQWGYQHKKVQHAQKEFARDENGDGLCEVHCNTIEGIWSLLRSWLRPHRGVSQEKLPLYVVFFEWLYNLKKRGKKAITETLKLLLKKQNPIST